MFDGIRDGRTTPEAWRAALADWERARQQWAHQHGVPLDAIPGGIGNEPFDWKLI